MILGAIDADVDITLVELSELLRRKHEASFAPSTVWRFLDRHDLTFKKTAHASEQERPDVAARRQAWFDAQPDLDPENLVFIDETAVSTKMDRLRGRAPRGQRCRAPIPHGHWKTITFVVALRLCGLTAPMVLDGPMNGPAFLADVELDPVGWGGFPRPHRDQSGRRYGACAAYVPLFALISLFALFQQIVAPGLAGNYSRVRSRHSGRRSPACSRVSSDRSGVVHPGNCG